MPKLNELWIVPQGQSLDDDDDIYLTEREAREAAKYFTEQHPAAGPYQYITLAHAVRDYVRASVVDADDEG